MTPAQESGRAPRRSRDTQRPAVCRTCTSCRQKKVRCCGTRPRCAECSLDDLDCAYPQDRRREPRPTRARVKRLEAAVASMLDHLKASGVAPADAQPEEWISRSSDSGVGLVPAPQGHGLVESAAVTASHPAAASGSTTGGPDVQAGFVLSPPSSRGESANAMADGRLDDFNPMFSGQSQDHQPPGHTGASLTSDIHPAQARSPQSETPGHADRDTTGLTGLSSREARVAGVSHDHGCVYSVHGLASMMNRTSREYKSNTSPAGPANEAAMTGARARLISYAALQKQRESWIPRQPQTTIDFDGCDPELAMHLLELHFNRQHYAYLVSYRPAIMDSICSGGGPWVNKLLLNAIYFCSCPVSDRQCLQEDPTNPQSAGARFYDRFCQLLGGEISKPSIPSAVAMLLTSASLVSHGRSSAGWNLSGLAYRMIIDLGCHLTVGSDPQTKASSDPSGQRVLNVDIEQEMRKRLYWGAFATDATQSLYLGRPCMFAPVEARVPLCFLDTFEELERWEPYSDPQAPPTHPPTYPPQPAHGVSTFEALVRLFQVSTRITKMYGIDTIKQDTQHVQKEMEDIEAHLHVWSDSLPGHLRFDPEGLFVPPPHQITPHTTFHALNILLHRAFLEDGHLCHHSNSTLQARSEEACIRSALAIEKFLRSYRNTFTLRGAPFLICYATYSAVTVILHQERHNRGKFVDLISFFWTCLSELQRGCNFGMKKPLAVLRDMVREYDVSIKEGGAERTDNGRSFLQPSLDERIFLPLTMHQPGSDRGTDIECSPGGDNFLPNLTGGLDQLDPMLGTSASGPMWHVDDRERSIWQDTLYGLFTSPFPVG